MTYLLDTNVVSEPRKKQPHPRVTEWLASKTFDQLFLSCLVIGEIRLGIEQMQRRDPHQADNIQRWFVTLRTLYEGRILPVTTDIAEEWARMQVPDPLPIIDGFIAATAKVHDLTLVTRDTGRLAQYGVTVFNPFEPIR